MGKLSAEQMNNAVETQDVVWRGITSHSEVVQPRENRLLELLGGFTQDQAVACAGEIGKRMKAFADLVNPSHPDLTPLMEKLPDWSAFSSRLTDALTSVRTKLEKGESASDDREAIDSVDQFRRLSRTFDRPKPRLLREQSERDSYRLAKKYVKHVSLKHTYIQGENCFYTKPESLKVYACQSEECLDLIRELKDRQTTFESHGMKEVAAVFAKRIAQVEQDMIGHMEFGFYRLKPDEAALSLARFHGFRWNDHQGVVIVPFTNFEGHSFWQDEKEVTEESRRYEDIEEMRRMEEVKRWVVFKEKKLHIVDTIGFHYQPRLYPLGAFGLPMPARVSEILTATECHPIMNNSPIFDYYWVVVPGINVNHPLIHKKVDVTPTSSGVKQTAAPHWMLRNEKGVMERFDDGMEAAIALDRRLVSEGLAMPAVLGERDGRCYFLCMWV